MRKPNLLIIGVARAGTSSLFAHLAGHPEIGPSRVKEPYYFYPDGGQSRADTLERYLRILPQRSSCRYLMEASAGHFTCGDQVASRVRDELGEPRLIVIFRDPIERVLSAFKGEMNRGLIEPGIGFETYIDMCEERARLGPRPGVPSYTGVRGSLYAETLEHWFQLFPLTLRVVMFEDFSSRPTAVMNDLCTWLEIPAYPPDTAWEKHNVSVAHKSGLVQEVVFALNRHAEPFLGGHPRVKKALRTAYLRLNARPIEDRLPESIRARLRDLFAASNARVRMVLTSRGHRDLPAWLRDDPITATAGESTWRSLAGRGE